MRSAKNKTSSSATGSEAMNVSSQSIGSIAQTFDKTELESNEDATVQTLDSLTKISVASVWKSSTCPYTPAVTQTKITERYLNKYERACIIGSRTMQIANGARPIIESSNKLSNSLSLPSYLHPGEIKGQSFSSCLAQSRTNACALAEAEYLLYKTPFFIRRYLPGATAHNHPSANVFEDWDIQDMRNGNSFS